MCETSPIYLIVQNIIAQQNKKSTTRKHDTLLWERFRNVIGRVANVPANRLKTRAATLLKERPFQQQLFSQHGAVDTHPTAQMRPQAMFPRWSATRTKPRR